MQKTNMHVLLGVTIKARPYRKHVKNSSIEPPASPTSTKTTSYYEFTLNGIDSAFSSSFEGIGFRGLSFKKALA